MIRLDHLIAEGHENIRAKHRTTFEITKDNYLTLRGDCIIGINANKGARDLDEELKRLIIREETYVYIVIYLSNELYEIVKGKGSSKLTLTNGNKIIVRKSDFISDATIAIRSNKSARDLRRDLINKLRTEKPRFLVSVIAGNEYLIDEEIFRIFINNAPIEDIM
ncbi:MAG: DUF371 domain-containing protein [Sulfolobaceae archaeon]